jgi:hypothetical protein
MFKERLGTYVDQILLLNILTLSCFRYSLICTFSLFWIFFVCRYVLELLFASVSCSLESCWMVRLRCCNFVSVSVLLFISLFVSFAPIEIGGCEICLFLLLWYLFHRLLLLLLEFAFGRCVCVSHEFVWYCFIWFRLVLLRLVWFGLVNSIWFSFVWFQLVWFNFVWFSSIWNCLFGESR